MKKILIITLLFVGCEDFNTYRHEPIITNKQKIDSVSYLYTYEGLGYSSETFIDTVNYNIGDTLIGRKRFK